MARQELGFMKIDGEEVKVLTHWYDKATGQVCFTRLIPSRGSAQKSGFSRLPQLEFGKLSDFKADVGRGLGGTN